MPYNYWIYNASPSPGRLQINIASIGPSAVNNVYALYNNGTGYTYSSSKNYQIVTHTVGHYATAASFSVSPAWSDELKYVNGMTAGSSVPSGVTQSFFHYSSPTTTTNSTRRLTYNANGTFSSTSTTKPGITDFKLNELDFNIVGFSYYKETSSELLPTTKNSLGWHYDKSSDIYFWYDYCVGTNSTSAQNIGFFPVGGPNGSKFSDIGFRLKNCLYKFIPYTNFNFSFNYKNTGNFPLRIYTFNNQPSNIPSNLTELATGTYSPPTDAILLATINPGYLYYDATSGITYSSVTNSVPINFYGITGNKYLVFVGGFAGLTASSTTYSSIYVQNLQYEGGYHPGNNRRYVMTNYATHSDISNITNATYSTFLGYGNTYNATSSLINPGLNKIFAKIGNGTFKEGIWENGVWNSGWRVDEYMFDFHNVFQFFSYNKNKRWRVQIVGPTSSVSNFNIGDNVSIGNIIAIDINEDRKLLKGYYTIINKTDVSIIVEFDNNFPIRRIEKDSENHRIYVTKNIWLSGGFLNGYFKGIWNYGLFKGYPLITEMFDSHWIDGIFDGGHFSTTYYTVPNFVSTLYSSGNVGLTFSSAHGLVVGDLININKDNKNINPQYDGEHYVLSVENDYQITIDVNYGIDLSNESGKITTTKSKGVLQKVEFKSNNISKVTSNLSMNSNDVFIYNSWMDINYDSSYATNLGKPQYLLNTLSRKSYSENNLFGYITNDILESDSTFRDSFSTTIRKYKLGTKYKIFSDYIGDSGKFEDDFGGTQSDSESNFINQGWTFSRYDTSSLTFSRTVDLGIDSITGEELKIQAIGSGGILDVSTYTSNFVLNKNYSDLERLRYTKVEFDLVTFSSYISQTLYQSIGGLLNLPVHYPNVFKLLNSNYTYLLEPPIHFNNLNIVTRQFTTSGITSSVLLDATYLPVYQNINHLTTKNKRKVEYFYNKRNLGMHFYGLNSLAWSDLPNGGMAEYIIDNLHFYEVDMIPFFQYFTDENINRGIQIPFQGISPFIDYSNSNFNFVNNINIGLDSIQTQNSNTVISGVGVGAGTVYSSEIYATVNVAASSINNTISSAPFSLSDSKSKTNIIKIGESLNGINIYQFNFKNNLDELYQGILAQELIGTKFESALKLKDEYYYVDYSKIDVEFRKIN